mmetsp:Transcript_10775/g.29223  ORF Transcript_10775/g.29223 Transcript_10775/m.29223 type:complete len:321 (+) Transcript_10775:594-1556(+)
MATRRRPRAPCARARAASTWRSRARRAPQCKPTCLVQLRQRRRPSWRARGEAWRATRRPPPPRPCPRACRPSPSTPRREWSAPTGPGTRGALAPHPRRQLPRRIHPLLPSPLVSSQPRPRTRASSAASCAPSPSRGGPPPPPQLPPRPLRPRRPPPRAPPRAAGRSAHPTSTWVPFLTLVGRRNACALPSSCKSSCGVSSRAWSTGACGTQWCTSSPLPAARPHATSAATTATPPAGHRQGGVARRRATRRARCARKSTGAGVGDTMGAPRHAATQPRPAGAGAPLRAAEAAASCVACRSTAGTTAIRMRMPPCAPLCDK